MELNFPSQYLYLMIIYTPKNRIPFFEWIKLPQMPFHPVNAPHNGTRQLKKMNPGNWTGAFITIFSPYFTIPPTPIKMPFIFLSKEMYRVHKKKGKKILSFPPPFCLWEGIGPFSKEETFPRTIDASEDKTLALFQGGGGGLSVFLQS